MTTTSSPDLVCRPEDLTAAWLAQVLDGTELVATGGTVRDLAVEPVGTGQMGDTFRVSFGTGSEDTAPRSVIAKFASTDDRSRSTGLMTRAYEIEVGFYGQVAGVIRIRMPRCYHGQCDNDTGWFVLLLEDLVGTSQGDQLGGCGAEVAAACLEELARLHGPAWNRGTLARVEWLQRGGADADGFLAGLVTSLWPGFVERYRDRLDPEHRALGDRFIGVLEPWLADRPLGTTVTHGDFRLDNMLFPAGETRPYVVDWQTAAWGPAASDVAYFLGGSLTPDARRRFGSTLLDGYHRALESEGVQGFDREQLDLEYQRLCFGGLVMTVGASMLVKRTDRGDDMFVTSLARYAQQALDLDAEATLPSRRD